MTDTVVGRVDFGPIGTHKEPAEGLQLTITSLRDQMAMSALTGMLSYAPHGQERDYAIRAYHLADAMLEVRDL